MTRIAHRATALLVVLALVAAFVATLPAPVYANSQSELEATREEYKRLKEQAKEINNRLDALEGNIDYSKASATQKEAQRAVNQERIDNLQAQIDIKLQEIEIQERIVSQKQDEIAQKQKEYDDNYHLFTERLVAIYKMNNAGILSTVLTVDSYSDMLGVANALQAISQHDTDMLDDLEAKRLVLEAEKADLDATLADLEAARDDLDADLQALEDANSQLGWEIDQAYAQIASDEAEMQRLSEEREQIEAEMEDMWKSLAASTGAYIGGDLTWPVPTHNGDAYISSRFGYRTLYGRSNFHTGTDIARGPTSSILGSSIVAANDGTVIAVSTSNASSGYGYYLIVDHGGGVRTLYAHCNSISAYVGQPVIAGQTIATVGNTGNSTGPHLHFELRINNTQQVDAYPYLTGQKSL